MARKIGMAALVAALVGVSLAAVAQDNERGVTVLRGNNVTSEGVSMGIGGTGTDTAPANAASGINLTGNVNAVRTGSAMPGARSATRLPAGSRGQGASQLTVEARDPTGLRVYSESQNSRMLRRWPASGRRP